LRLNIMIIDQLVAAANDGCGRLPLLHVCRQ
jgi:hypothetical protein